MTTNAVVSFEDSVKDRLKDIVAELIPEDRWDGLVRATVKDFESVYLPKLVKEELTAKYKQMIQEEFNKTEWREQYNNRSQTIASEMVSTLIKEAAPDIIASMIGLTVQNMIQQISLNTSRGY